MFFRPPREKLIVDGHRERQALRFDDAHTTLVFDSLRPECVETKWEVASVWRTNSFEKIHPRWWSVESAETVRSDCKVIYLPILNFWGAAFSDNLINPEHGRCDSDRSLYMAIVTAGSIQLNLRLNGEAIIPLMVDLDYRIAADECSS